MSHIEFNSAESRTGLPIIEAVVDGKPLLLHSKYDPVKEAERFIDSCKERIEAADHILFYGAGMGYHIKSFFERYPEKIASSYEPFEEVAKLYKKSQAHKQLQHFVVRTEQQPLSQALSVFYTDIHLKFEIIVLPSYGKWQDEQLSEFVSTFKSIVDIKKLNVNSTLNFSRRWTINALMNLPKTMEQPNFLVEKKCFFKGKPVIIVSAGPSLSEEMQNLRQIKESGTAYIFAVGSANKALIQAGVYPDAVCTYDPQNHNYTVFNEMINNNIDTIPMIYGTTVGFETIDYYKGPKLYFPVSKDKLTVNFHKDLQMIVDDASTIAIVTLQLLDILEVSKVILVGQNFAYKNEKYYAEGIIRYDEKNKDKSDHYVNSNDLQQKVEIEDVHGGKVLSNNAFIWMRNDMENHLSRMNIPVINTTNGGAAIKGTTFKRLDELMEEELTKKVVVEDWWKQTKEAKSVLNKTYLHNYRKAFDSFEQQDCQLQTFMAEFKSLLSTLTDNAIRQKLKQLDDLLQNYQRNIFYETTILPIAELSFEKLKSENQLISALKDIRKKSERIIEVFTEYLQQCKVIYDDIAPIVSNYTLPKLNEISNQVKPYVATSGVFHYEGEWNRKFPPKKERIPGGLSEEEKRAWHKQKKLEDKIEFPNLVYVETTEKGALIQFRFKGSELSLYGLNLKDEGLKLCVQIDKKKHNVNVNGERYLELNQFIRKNIFTINNLKNTMHLVTIEILSNNPHFLFEGIEIDNNGRAYHRNEVEQVEDLEVGKRIRCHYKATYNKVGEFSGLGEETMSLLLIEPSAKPDGDFYFIMVDEVDGEKKLIADRTVQNYISYNTLKTSLLTNKEKIKVGENYYITLPSMGRFRGDKENDWYKYIESKNYPNEDLYWSFMDLKINFGYDVPKGYPEKGVFRGSYPNAKGIVIGESAHDWFMITDVKGTYSTYGFRPKLIGENML